MMKKTFTLIIMLFMTTFLVSQNYPYFPIGQTWIFPDARSLAMAGAGTISLATPGAMIHNPASLTLIDRDLTIDLTLNARKLEERRSYPLYDRFQSFLLNSTYVINNNWYPDFQGGVAYWLPFGSTPWLIIAGGSYPEIDYQYSYREEVRENIFGDQLIAYNRIKTTGMLRRYGFALAATLPPLPRLSLGVQAGFLQGEANYQSEVNYIQGAERVVFADQSRELSNTPLILSFGSLYRFNERVSAGVDFALPYSVNFRTLPEGIELSETIEYPFKLNAGFEFRARQQLQARLNVDVGYEFWSDKKYSSQIGGNIPSSQTFDDVFYFKTGIEHIFFNQIPFRVGAQYKTSYLARGTTQTLLSAGTGFFRKSWQVDVAGAFGRISYRWEDLFDDALFVDDPNFQSRIDLDTVDETTFLIMVSVKYALNF